MNRREFLRGGVAAAGGLVASASLPALADNDPALFDSRGIFERLSLTYHHIHIGLQKPFSVLHISDTHLSEAYYNEGEDVVAWAAKRKRAFGACQEAALAASLKWAKDHADYILHTGDLIDFQSRANFDLVRKYYGQGANQFGTTGNHEYQREPMVRGIRNTAEYNATSRAELDAAFGFDTLFSSTVACGVNFVCIDQSYGTVTPEQVERFRAEAAKGLPIVLCMHAPFMTPEIWLAECKFWRRSGARFTNAVAPDPAGDYKRQNEDPVTADFVRYLRSEPLLKGILAGHLHIAVEDRFSPTAMEYVVGGNFMCHGAEILFT